MQIILLGRPISKKNSRRVFKTGGRMIFYPSSAYERFENHAIKQITEKADQTKFTGPVTVRCDFYIKGKYHVDGDNLFSGILDVLEKAHVITNDENVMRGVWEKWPGAAVWSTKIEVERFRREK